MSQHKHCVALPSLTLKHRSFNFPYKYAPSKVPPIPLFLISNSKMTTPQPPHLSVQAFEEIELTPFPRHLPLRPSKPSILRTQWRKTSVRITAAIIISLIVIISAGVAAFSVGKSIQRSHHAKHPDPTMVVTPSAVTTVQVTQTSVASTTSEMLVSSWQSTAVATATASAVVETKKDGESCETCGDEGHDLDM